MLKQYTVVKYCLIAATALWLSNAGPLGVVSIALGAEAPHAATEEAGHGGEHVTQNPITWASDLALWSLVVFLVFLFVLTKMAWEPLTSALDRREAKIREDIAHAESNRIQAEQMLAAHAKKLEAAQDEIRGILAEARRDAEHARQEILSTAEKEAEAAKQRAIHEIERVRDQALEELFSEMGRVVSSATERVIGRVLTEPDHDRLISEALTEFARR